MLRHRVDDSSCLIPPPYMLTASDGMGKILDQATWCNFESGTAPFSAIVRTDIHP